MAARSDEQGRLAALRASGLMDSPADPMFDRLTQLICTGLRVPVGLVSLVDESRQFFKSQCGLPEPWASQRETPLTHSFCQHVVKSGKPLIVNDARQHSLVKDNLAIRDLNVIAYLGVPIVDAEGYVLGSLGAIDDKPREWTKDDMNLLRAMSAQLTADLVVRLRSHALAVELATQRAIEDDRRAMQRLNIHDLRTPLSALLLGLDVVKILGEVNEEQATYLGMCKRNCNAMLDMINRLLEIDVIDQRGGAALQRSPSRPELAIRTAMEQVEALAREKSIEMKLDAPASLPDVLADIDKLERVLVNLFANAIKFCKPKQRGSVIASAEKVEDAGTPFVRFEVRDDGIGIANVEHIFEEGVVLDGKGGSRRSTGLGLTFCKRIVEAHGGQIGVDSTEGNGSTFYFTIPVSCA